MVLAASELDRLRDNVRKSLMKTLHNQGKKSSLEASIAQITYEEDMNNIVDIVDLCLLHRERIPTVLAMAKKDTKAFSTHTIVIVTGKSTYII